MSYCLTHYPITNVLLIRTAEMAYVPLIENDSEFHAFPLKMRLSSIIYANKLKSIDETDRKKCISCIIFNV